MGPVYTVQATFEHKRNVAAPVMAGSDLRRSRSISGIHEVQSLGNQPKVRINAQAAGSLDLSSYIRRPRCFVTLSDSVLSNGRCYNRASDFWPVLSRSKLAGATSTQRSTRVIRNGLGQRQETAYDGSFQKKLSQREMDEPRFSSFWECEVVITPHSPGSSQLAIS